MIQMIYSLLNGQPRLSYSTGDIPKKNRRFNKTFIKRNKNKIKRRRIRNKMARISRRINREK